MVSRGRDGGGVGVEEATEPSKMAAGAGPVGWKVPLNAFEIAFEGRLSAARR